MAWLYKNQDKYNEAELLFQWHWTRAPRHGIISEQSGWAPPKARHRATVQMSAGNLLEGVGTRTSEHGIISTGKCNETKLLFQQSLAINEKVLGPEHSEIALSLNNLAVFYNNQDKYDEVELLYQWALAIHEKVFGPEHPGTALLLINLAELYKNGETELVYQWGLQSMRKYLDQSTQTQHYL
ncbi:hypothetical protein BC938DRAFT_475315 [Jimgerdemannia flammicorona]|uniref:Tetratricopeptide repeat-domain-containing protein n=1 Tax=Jimgerdemannia flammicorona TaxID=994334 RepID=A0A433QRV4_9FUNG|nr:hypothetical protein BC938DRAFT_475315 [Jimgerdemannia flammicorona]